MDKFKNFGTRKFVGNNHDPHESHHDQHHNQHQNILSRLKENLNHQHPPIEKIDDIMESNELGIKTLKVGFVILTCTAIFQLLIVLISGSTSLLASTIHSFTDASTSFPLWIAFALAQRGVNRKYTYGYGKIEDIAGVVIILIIFFSACIAGYESISKIINPLPIKNLTWVSLASIISFIGNEWVAIYRINVGKQIGSAALVADGYHARIDGFTSLAVLFGVIGTWAGYPIIDPLVGIGTTIVILFIVKDTAKSVWIRLVDAIEPEILEQIEHVILHFEEVQSVREVRARWIGHRIHAELMIDIDPDLSVKQADILVNKLEKNLRENLKLVANVIISVKPATRLE